MRRVVRTALPALLALVLAACRGETPPGEASRASPESTAALDAEEMNAVPARGAADLDTRALRQRASTSLAANRLFAPAGDNAVEDYLALREREPGDVGVETALIDLAPYVMIAAEQATSDGAFGEARRLIDLLARIDVGAPAVPRLRSALAAAEALDEQRIAQAEAQAQTAADAEAARLADAARPAESTPRADTAAAAPTPPERTTPRPATTPPPRVAVPPPAAPPATAPATVAAAPATLTSPVARTLLKQVPPRFPEAAARRRLEGSVEVRVSIAADGRVDGVDVLRSDPPGVFDREAVLAVRRWRYAPGDSPSETRVVLSFKRP
jgi:protein TonB